MDKLFIKSLIFGIVFLVLVSGFAQAQQYNQSPLLDELVKKGELPALEERLPENPKVYKVHEEIGKYGGTLHLAYPWVGSDSQFRAIRQEPLMEKTPFINRFVATEDLEPNIIDTWEVGDESKTFTFHIREGLKWSDGEPVTTEDVRFTLEDIYAHEEVTLVYPDNLKAEGEPAELEIIDESTFKLKFSKPRGLFLQNLQTYTFGHPELIKPSHYLKKFHKDYTALKDIEPYLEEEGLGSDDWTTLLEEKMDVDAGTIQTDPDLPSLYPWVMKEKPSPSVTIFERNPYYWKVDEEGNQLPYIDKIRMEQVQDREMLPMKIIAGEVDFECGAGGLSLENLSMYKENEEDGNYDTLLLKSPFNTPVVYYPNITHPDAGEYLSDPRFRQALSLGMDREEINDLVFYGMGEPIQATARSGSIFSEEEFAEAYIEYNPEKANNLLDEMGLDKKNSEGWRLTPDGEVVTIPIRFFEVNIYLEPTSEIVTKQWEELGIKADFRLIQRELFYERKASNQNVMAAWHQDPLDPGYPFLWFVPAYGGRNFGSTWYQWYSSNGESGEEPPVEIKELYNSLEVIQSTSSDEELLSHGKKILRSQAENIWVIGTVGNLDVPAIVSKNLGNITVNNLDAQWGINMAEQIYFKNN